MNNQNTEKRFRDLMLEARLEEIDSILSQCKEDFVPSRRFERKMARIMKNIKRGKEPNYVMPMRKRVAIVLIAAIVLVSLVGCAWANRKQIGAFVQDFFEDYLNLTISIDGGENNAPKTIEKEYRPTYIPEGYEETKYEANFLQVLIAWENGETTQITFIQNTLNKATHIVDTDQGDIEIVNINDYEIYYFSLNEVTSYVWTTGSYLFTLRIRGDLPFDEITQIIESVKEK